MKGIVPLFLGIFGTFFFSWAGMLLIPNYQIGHLEPQMDEEETDIYPAPKSGMADRGRRVFAANGCVYCHSQQVRADYAASDIERKWGQRRSAPRDYIFERPALLGKMRMGPDLANIGKRAPSEDENAPAPGTATAGASPAAQGLPAAVTPPGASPGAPVSTSPAAPAPANAGTSPAAAAPAAASSPGAPPASPAAIAAGSPAPAPTGAANAAVPPPPVNPAANAATSADTVVAPDGAPIPYTAAWHHRHLYSPRSVTLDSNMPAYHFLYEKREITGEPAADALKLTGPDAPPAGWEIVPTYEAKCLVAYLMSLDQSHELKEAKATAVPPSPPAPGKEAK